MMIFAIWLVAPRYGLSQDARVADSEHDRATAIIDEFLDRPDRKRRRILIKSALQLKKLSLADWRRFAEGLRQRDLALVGNLQHIRYDHCQRRERPSHARPGATAAMKRADLDFRVLLDPQRGHAGFGDRLKPMVEYLLAAKRPLHPRSIRLASFELA